MALSGSLTTNAYGGVRSLTLTWSATQSVSGNTSTINWTLSGSGSTANNNPWYMTGPTKVVIDGTQVHYSTSRIQLRSGTVVASGSRTITHNSDGAKSITIRIEGAIYTTSVNCTAEQSFTLNQIPRGATITSAPNFTDEATSILVKYSNPAGASMELCIKSGDQSKILVNYRKVTGSSYTFALTQSERQALQAYATKNTATVVFVLRSDLSGNRFFSESAKTLTIANPAPTLNPTVTDGNSTTVALTGDSSKMVKYYSDAKVTFGASAVKSATIKSKKVTCGSKSLTADGTMQDVESGTFAFSVTDSRGNTTTKTVTKTLVNYVKLTCDMGSGVPDATGKFTFRVSGNFFNASFGAVTNTLSVQYRYRVDGGVYSEYKTMTVSKSGNSYTATVTLTGLDYTKPHQFQAQAVDKLATVTSQEKTVRATPVFDWSETDFNFNVPVTVQGQSLARCGMTATISSNVGTFSGAKDIFFNKSLCTYGGSTLMGGDIQVKNDGIYLISASIHYTEASANAWCGVYVSSGGVELANAYETLPTGMGTVVTAARCAQLQAGARVSVTGNISNSSAGGAVKVDSRTTLTVVQLF